MKSIRIKATATSLIIILAIIFLITIAAICYFVNYDPIPADADGKIRIEIIKSLLGILSIAFIGGIVAALFKGYEQHQEQSRIRIQAKIEFMKRLGELYRMVKSSRRKLNANGIQSLLDGLSLALNKDQIKFYQEQMGIIDNVQLEIEGRVTIVKNTVLYNYNDKVSFYLDRMEKYLRKILKEFEENFQSIKNSDIVNLDSLIYLKEFTYPNAINRLIHDESGKPGQKEYCFKLSFANSYHEVVNNLT